jgi:ferritin-like metal-binding protein YciE
MSDRTIDEQLTKNLTDVHAIEVQALEQMRLAPRIAGTPELAGIFRAHREETEEHERLVAAELRRRGAAPSRLKDVAGRAGGWGMILFAKLNPDSPGKLAMHAYSYEHMELAAYALLGRIAARADDEHVVALAARVGEQERAMAGRLAERWDQAVDASLREKDAGATRDEIVAYLRDAHALEAQALQLLVAGPRLAGVEELDRAFEEHLVQTREHQRLVDARLAELGARPGRFQAGALRLGAVNIGAFFKAQPQTPVKLAGFAYAFEALETAAYELLRRTAHRAGDEATAALAEHIAGEERAAGEHVAATWDAVVEATLARHVLA